MAELSDDRLAAILASVGDHLVVPTGTTTDRLTSTVPPPNGSSPHNDEALVDDATTDPTDPIDQADRAVLADDEPDGPGGDRAPAAPAGRRRRHGRRGPLGRRGRPPQDSPRQWSAEAEDDHDLAAAADRAGRGVGPGRGRRLALVAAVVVVVATAVGTVVAPVREAVAGWLGIGTTEVVQVGQDEGDPGGLPFLGDDLVPVARATAERRLGAELPDTSNTELGPPPVLATPPEGGVILAWDDGATTLWVRRADMPPDETVDKLITFDDRLERIDDLGDDAAIVEGPHVLGTPLRRLAAGTVLVWVDGDLEHRLESDLDPEEMVEIARTITSG